MKTTTDKAYDWNKDAIYVQRKDGSFEATVKVKSYFVRGAGNTKNIARANAVKHGGVVSARQVNEARKTEHIENWEPKI